MNSTHGPDPGDAALGDTALDHAAFDHAPLDHAGFDDADFDDATVDGNAVGGLLIEVFGTEMTTATVVCGTCGAVSQVAGLAVYLRELGTVVRCRSCHTLLMAFTRIRGVTCVDLAGLTSLTPPALD